MASVRGGERRWGRGQSQSWKDLSVNAKNLRLIYVFLLSSHQVDRRCGFTLNFWRTPFLGNCGTGLLDTVPSGTRF